ncbi:hypothetical protein HWI79_3496 [Cryptosporidium felis]|nr:hypothetical protein HWI79_3496 [Cryptosporidium felis]
MSFNNERYYTETMSINQESNSYSEGANESIYSMKQMNSNIDFKSSYTTPKKASIHGKPGNYQETLRKKVRSKKTIRNELSELKKIEMEFAKEIDSARSSKHSSVNRGNSETYHLEKKEDISLLEFEILTETINTDFNNDFDSIIQEITYYVDKINNICSTLENKKLNFPLEYYKKWIIEYYNLIHKLRDSSKRKSSEENNFKLNFGACKIIRSLFYNFVILSEILNKERKNNKRQINNNSILKKDNIKLSNAIKLIQINELNRIKKINTNHFTINKIINFNIIENDQESRKVDVMVGTNEDFNIENDNILNDLNPQKNRETLSKIDSINEISSLRTGRFQDAQNYREGIMKITQEYSGLYDRTRNEYIERLLERQKNHDMEIKLMITSHKEDIDKMNDYFMDEKRKIIEEHDRQLNEILEESKRKVDILKSDHSLELRLVQQKYKQIINDNNKEKDNSIQAFKIKVEHILIDMESNKDRELLNMQIEYENKINELKEQYKNVIGNLELELQRKELQFQEEKKMIIEEFVTAHKKEIDYLKNQSIRYFDDFDKATSKESDSKTDIPKGDGIFEKEKNDKSIIFFSDDQKYNKIVERLERITNRISLKQNENNTFGSNANTNKSCISSQNQSLTTNTTASSSTIPSNNVY